MRRDDKPWLHVAREMYSMVEIGRKAVKEKKEGDMKRCREQFLEGVS